MNPVVTTYVFVKSTIHPSQATAPSISDFDTWLTTLTPSKFDGVIRVLDEQQATRIIAFLATRN